MLNDEFTIQLLKLENLQSNTFRTTISENVIVPASKIDSPLLLISVLLLNFRDNNFILYVHA